MKSPRLSFVTLDDGAIIYDVIGMDPEDEDNVDDEDQSIDSDEDEDDDEDLEDDDDSEDDDESVSTLKKKLEEAEEARRKSHRRMQRADRAKANADRKLKELQNADGTKDLEKANEKIAELEKQLSEAGGTDKTSIVREEFRDLSGYKWHNPKIAFSLLDLDEVDVDESGNVDTESLADAAKDLAKNHPYLISSADGSNDSDDEEEDKGDKPKSGFHGNRKRRKKSTDREALNRKYPSLNSRR